MEVQATRDFSESRKLTLVANDLVTVIDHGWVKEGWDKGTKGKTSSDTIGLCGGGTGV